MFTDKTIEQLITFLPRVMEVNQNKEPVAKAELVLAMKTLFNAPFPKRYKVFLNQDGTTDPPYISLDSNDGVTPLIIENSIGDIVWFYNSAGIYDGVLIGAFPEGKTFCYKTSSPNNDSNYNFELYRYDNDKVRLVIIDIATGFPTTDLGFSFLPILIEVEK